MWRAKPPPDVVDPEDIRQVPAEMDRTTPWHPLCQPGFCGIRGTACVLVVIAGFVTFPLLLLERNSNPNTNVNITDTHTNTT